MSEIRTRRSIRLPGWDYRSARAYFVTVCAYQRHLLFEEPLVASIIARAWNEIPVHFNNVSLDAFVIMPNHIHGVVVIERDPRFVGARYISPLRTTVTRTQAPGLGAIIGTSKAAVTRELRRQDHWNDDPFWQRNYYERIIRDDDELARVRKYVANNPTAWQFDSENPARRVDDGYDLSWAWLESGVLGA